MSVYWVTGCLPRNHLQTRPRTSAGRPATRASARLPAALGAPPPECAVRQDFDDAPGLQAVLLDDSASVRRAWERDMERRMASSERMLHEIHSMVLALRLAPALSVAAPAAAGTLEERFPITFLSGASPFQGKARLRPDLFQPVRVSSTTGGGGCCCRGDTFRFTHKCRRCNPTSNPPAGPSSAPGPPDWSTK